MALQTLDVNMEYEAVNSTKSVWVQLSNLADKTIIQKQLSGQYDFINGENNGFTESDLFILDPTTFRDTRQDLVKLKKTVSPVFLPVILLVKEQRLKKYFNHEFGEICDDILPVPISPTILKFRINSLLKQRRNTLKIKRKSDLAYQAVNSTNVGITITDASQEDNPIIFVNDGFETITGYSKSEIIGRNCRFLQNENNDQENLNALRRSITKGQPAVALLKNYKKDGEPFWNELTVSPIRDQNQQIRYFVGIQNDVTVLINTQKELERLVDEKKILIQEIHHRIKNNLAVIVALLEMKIMDSDNEKVQTTLKETRTRIFSIAQVHELLYQQSNMNEIDFSEYIEGLVDHLNRMYDQGHIDFKLDLVPIQISIDQAVPAGMLVSELITNAFKHAFKPNEQGTVKIKIKKVSKEIKITVSDDGKGLPENKKLEDSKGFTKSILFILLQQLEAVWEYKSVNGFCFEFGFTAENYTGMAQQL